MGVVPKLDENTALCYICLRLTCFSGGREIKSLRLINDAREFVSSERKAEHIKVCLEHDVSSSLRPGWEDVHLSHKSLPEIDLEEIDLSANFLGRRFRYPIVLSALTGGHPWSQTVNEVLGRIAQDFNIVLEVGSQRTLVEDPGSLSTYTIAREKAPDAFIVANIGASQLLSQKSASALSLSQIEECMEAIKANALAVHLNFLQESVMLEGETRAKGCLRAIEKLVSSVSLPVIVKETGSGIPGSQVEAIKHTGAAALDLGGAGGTSMAMVESYRSALHYSRQHQALGEAFAGWGIPTVVSLVQCRDSGLPIIASGGIRDGLDMAKALVMGADLAGTALPVLKASVKGYEETFDLIKVYIAQLTAAAFLMGARNLEEMKRQEFIILGRTREWLERSGYSIKSPEGRVPLIANKRSSSVKKIRGIIQSGVGQGDYFTQLDWVKSQFKEKLGFEPYPGTLNLKLDNKNEKAYQDALKERGVDIVPPTSEFCSSKSYPIKLGRMKAAVILPCVPEYPGNIVEIMAPVKVKEKLNVKDGDELEFTIGEK